MTYLYPKQILYLHQQIIAVSGGGAGVRDRGLLESAVYRPQASFGGQDLYPDLFSKVAALGHSLISNHPFIDGNKRTGFEAMRLMLRLNGYDLQASLDAKFKFVMNIAKGKLREQAIADWLRLHSRVRRKSRGSRGLALKHLRRFTVGHLYHQRNLKESFHVTHGMALDRCVSSRGHKSRCR